MKKAATINIGTDQELPLNVVTQKLAWLGTSGSGKSFGAMKLAEEMLDALAQIIAIDPVGIWWSLRLMADGKKSAYDQVYVFGGDHSDLPLTPEAGVLVGRILAERRISAVLDLSQFTTGETKKFLTDFADSFFQSKRQHRSPVHLFLEECQTYIPQDKSDREDPVMLNRWERLIKLFRNYGGGTSMISQQPQSVNKKCLNLADTLFAFRTIGSHERKAILGWVKGVIGSEAELVNNLPKLPTGTAHLWSPSWLGISRDIKILPKKTFDAGKTPEMGSDVIEPVPLKRADVKEIESQMAEMIDKVKQDDPHELRKRITELEKQLKIIPVPATKEVEKIDIEKLVAAQQAEIKRWIEGVLAKKLRAGVTSVSDQVRHVLDGMAAFFDDEKLFEFDFISDQGVSDIKKAITRDTDLSAPQVEIPPLSTSGDVLRDGLDGPKQRIVDAIAWLNSIGVQTPRAEAVSFVANYKFGSGGFNNPKGNLRKLGLIEYVGKCIILTEAGKRLANQPEAVLSAKELQDRVIARLDGPERKILKVLLAVWPKSMISEACAEASGYVFGTGGFNNPKGRLSTMNLITYPVRGEMRAADFLFLK